MLCWCPPAPVPPLTRRYGTHFVSGVGFRGAFIGSITVRLVDVKVAAGAAVSFKASYGKVSGMAELKTAMEDSLQTSDVTVRASLVWGWRPSGSPGWASNPGWRYVDLMAPRPVGPPDAEGATHPCMRPTQTRAHAALLQFIAYMPACPPVSVS